MNHVRIHGDPFSDSPESGQLRSFLRCAVGSGLRCALSLSGVPTRQARAGERTVTLTDGVREWGVATQLPPAEVDLVLRAEGERISATAPVVVFGADGRQAGGRGDTELLAGLQWPDATTVIVATSSMGATDLTLRVQAEHRWAGKEYPPHSAAEEDLAPWLSLPKAQSSNLLVHVCSDLFGAGTDLLIDAFVGRFAPDGSRLRLVLPEATQAQLRDLRERLGNAAASVEVAVGEFLPEHVTDAAAIVLPMRRFDAHQSRWLVQALASGRPVVAARFADNAQPLHGRGIVHAIGGRNIRDDANHGSFFAPHPAGIVASMQAALAEPSPSAAGLRAQAHVVAELTQARPASPPPAVPKLGERLPVVVLEAPLLETSSSAELTIATAQALHRRGNVDLRLIAVAPFRHDLAWLRRRAPELVPLLARNAIDADFWLSAGWPVRAARPTCRRWALRVDWEYGSLPQDLTPHVTEDADQIVVHSEHVYRSMTAAGRAMSTVAVVPHGVDESMHEDAPGAAEILQFKGDKPAVLFCGGMVWRKGFDVFLSAVLNARAAGHEFVVVVKDIGADQHYGRHHLGALLERMQNTPDAPPTLRIAADLSREQMASVYTACDVLLHPFRGEGFGMPLLEARACGLPVVATDGGAAAALMYGAGAHRIESVRRTLELPGAHVSLPWVLEPTPAHATELLGYVLSNLPTETAAARGIASAVREAYTWDSAAASIEQLAEVGCCARSVLEPAYEPAVVLPVAAAMLPTRAPVVEPAQG